jgi:ubiquinone/menaquinone biosynthesis C-methylase UbiE
MDNQSAFNSDQSLIYDSRSLIIGSNEYIVDTEDKSINQTDQARLNTQNAMLNPYIGLFAPKGYARDPEDGRDGYCPEPGHRILDVACGPGGWTRDVVRAHPGVYLIGIDNNKASIRYARQHEATRQNQHVSFELADIMQRFNCPPDTFDYINLRFLLGVIPKDKWGGLMLECFRVLKPGGCICHVESEAGLIASDADSKIMQATDLFLEVLWEYGKSFARNAIAITPMLPMFLQAARFEGIQVQPFLLNWSYGKPLHQNVLSDFVVALQEMRDIFVRTGKMADDEYTALCRGYIAEANLISHSAFWPVNRVWAYKPL